MAMNAMKDHDMEKPLVRIRSIVICGLLGIISGFGMYLESPIIQKKMTIQNCVLDS